MKRKLLRGNYDAKTVPETEKQVETTHEFEDAALSNLGGSIAFVRKGKLYEENN